MKIHYYRLFIVLTVSMFLASCVERGKPIEKTENTQQNQQNKVAKVEHYICQNGHTGSDKQGICPECNIAYTHNQAFHGLSIPQNSLKDPFQENGNSNATNNPAQNAYGDYHYTCPNGHAGGAGTAGTCPSCGTKLAHNQLYHR